MQMGWVQKLFIVSLGALVLSALYLSRKPLCINSRVVERVDFVSAKSSESAWRCSLNRDVEYGISLAKNLNNWEGRIQATEQQLWRLRPFQKPIRVVVSAERPLLFRLKGDTLFIGEALINGQGHLERGLIKAWLREQNPVFEQTDLPTEVMADFVQTELLGELSLEEPQRGLRTTLGARWPQVLKDSRGYCASPWKISEHYEACKAQPDRFTDAAWVFSLRPLLSGSLINAWNDLKLSQRLQSIRSTPDWAESFPISAFGVSGDIGSNGLMWAKRTVAQFYQAFSTMATHQNSAVVADLAALFSENLRRTGFTDAEPIVSFDVMVFSETRIERNSPILKQLADYASSKPGIKIALKDADSLWLLPARHRLPLSKRDGLKSEKTAVLRCGRFDFDWIFSFEEQTQKLFVIDSCGSKQPDLRPWIRDGAEAFGRSNRDFKFIQFHMPSLALRKSSLLGHADVLSVIQKRDVSDPVFQIFGWQELRWSQAAEAYNPRAYVDAIDWFRL